jgi:glycosyltransferase involved in cell wall biosynthesis
MNILLVSNVFPPGFVGGYELGAFEVATRLARRGHTVRVLSSDYCLDEKREMTELTVTRSLECVTSSRHRLPAAVVDSRGPFVHGRNARLMYAAMCDAEPDAVILFNLEGLGALGLVQFTVAAGYHPVLYVMDNVFRGARRDDRRWKRYLATCGAPDFLADVRPIAMSEVVHEEIRDTVGPEFPAAVIVPGWHGSVLQRNEVSADLREDGRCRFVHASRLTEHKGISIVLEAVALARERGADGFVVDLYGAGDVERTVQRVAAMGLTDVIRYRGAPAKDELCRRFAEYDALLLPTWEREPFGFVVPEAAANGCVPIVTAQMGAAEWFLDGVDCLKLRRDPLSFAGGILRFLSLSGVERSALRAGAQRTARTHLTLDRWIGVIENVVIGAAAGGGWNPVRAKQAEAAMLILDDLWRTVDDGSD